jgi:hypothetical protein
MSTPDSGRYQVKLLSEYLKQPDLFITAHEWKKVRYTLAPPVWNVNHSCYSAFGLAPSRSGGQSELETLSGELSARLRRDGHAEGKLMLTNRKHLIIHIDSAFSHDDERDPHIGYRLSCLVLGWVDKQRSQGQLREHMLYDLEMRYPTGRVHRIAPGLAAELVE